MKTTRNLTIATLLLIALAASAVLPAFAAASGPQTLPVTGPAAADAYAPAFVDAFAAADKSALKVTRVVVPGVFDYSVVQSGNSVPSSAGVLGQYASAAKKNNIGLLAHNYLAGSSFFLLSRGMDVQVYYSNGQMKTFTITNVLRFQATNPADFGDAFLDAAGKEISATSVFNRAYKGGGLTFQTCINANGVSTWGLLFVQAVPKK